MKLLTWSDLADGSRYEVLDARGAYGTPAPFIVRFLIRGIAVHDRPYQTEVAARTGFEKLVEGHSEMEAAFGGTAL